MRDARRGTGPALISAAMILVVVFTIELGALPFQSLRESNEELLQRIRTVHRLTPEQDAALRAVFAGSRYIGQANPAVTNHPATPQQCQAKLDELGVTYENPRFESICGKQNWVCGGNRRLWMHYSVGMP